MTVTAGFLLEYHTFAETVALAPDVASFLQLHYPQLTPEQLQAWQTAAAIRLDGKIVRLQQPLQAGQVVSVNLPAHPEAEVNTDWQLIWQNDELMAVYKPPLLPVSRTTRNLHNTLISLVRRQTPHYNAHLLHRLDTETDGLLLIAKNSAADCKWKKQLSTLILRKRYHANIYGVPAWQQKELICALSERIGSEIRSQMYVVDETQPTLYPKPKQSHSRFRRLAVKGGRALIECELITGRKHQIRAQLAHLGHPIVADKIYAHQGYYYLQRLALTRQQQEFTDAEIAALGGPHHQLTAVALEIQPYAGQKPIVLQLPWLD
ncbi:MAG: RluA family pseudouridine synthase [Marinobacterium sp.]|nr:RluA family pseudouridine synthase [Marinobacterium sp.]